MPRAAPPCVLGLPSFVCQSYGRLGPIVGSRVDDRRDDGFDLAVWQRRARCRLVAGTAAGRIIRVVLLGIGEEFARAESDALCCCCYHGWMRAWGERMSHKIIVDFPIGSLVTKR